jgi:outer membrane protein assembly factor BamB
VAGLLSVNAIAALACAPVMKFGPERQESGWPAYLGTPRHDEAARETLNPDPRPLWHVSMGRGVRGSPAIGESVIAAGTADRNLVLLDRASGEMLWRSRLDGTVRAGPLLDEDRLFVASEAQPEGRVYAVRLRDGHILWRTRAGSVTAPLAFDGDALYAGTEDGLVERFETEGGSLQWKVPVGGSVRAGPVVTPYGLVVAATNDTLYLLDRDSGSVRGRLPLPGSVLATPATDGRQLYLATVNGHVLAVDLASWNVRWDRDAGDAVYGAPSLVGDTLFVLARDGRLWLIPVNAPDSARSHALQIVATAGPTPVDSGRSVLVGGVTGEVLLVDAASGAIRWRAQVAAPIEEPPLVRDRQVVVVAGRGNIHTYR